MNCPRCLDRVLDPHHKAGIEIDVCPQCRGVWLDRDELDRLLTNSVTPNPFMKRPDLEERKPYTAPGSDDGIRLEHDGASREDDDWDDDDWDDDDDDDRRERPTSKKAKSKKRDSKKKRKKSWGELLGDALEDILD